MFPNFNYDTLAITGNCGADNGGSVKTGSYRYDGFQGYYKIIYNGIGGDPPIVHVFITDATSTKHTWAPNTDNDEDVITGVKGKLVIYLMWAATAGSGAYSQSQMEVVIKKTVQGYREGKIFCFYCCGCCPA